MPDRSLPGLADLDGKRALVVSQFPPLNGWERLDNTDILEVFGDLRAATVGIRKLRADCGVPPKDRIRVTLKAPPERIASLEQEAHIVKRLAGVGELTIDPQAVRPANAATLTSGNLQIIVHDVIDDAREKTRLQGELKELEKHIAGKEAKLSNENFVSRAPADVVEAEKTRLAELNGKRRAIQDSIKQLT